MNKEYDRNLLLVANWLNALRSEKKVHIQGIEKLVQELSRRHTPKVLSKKLEVSHRTAYHYKKGTRPVSISSFCNLMELSNKPKTEICKQFAKEFRGISCSSGSRQKIVVFPLEITNSLIYLIGYLYGDGSLSSRNYTIGFSDEYKNQMERIGRIIKKIFKCKYRIFSDKSKTELRIYSQAIHLFFHKVFEMPIGKKYNELHVPTAIRALPKKIRMEFIRGLMDADGGVCRIEDYSSLPRWFLHSPQIELTQKNKKFLTEIKEMLLEQGLYFNGPHYNNNDQCYKLISSGKNNFNKCQEKKVFRHNIKTWRMKKLCEGLGGSMEELVLGISSRLMSTRSGVRFPLEAYNCQKKTMSF
jgi:intein/homing endonuclease